MNNERDSEGGVCHESGILPRAFRSKLEIAFFDSLEKIWRELADERREWSFVVGKGLWSRRCSEVTEQRESFRKLVLLFLTDLQKKVLSALDCFGCGTGLQMRMTWPSSFGGR